MASEPVNHTAWAHVLNAFRDMPVEGAVSASGVVLLPLYFRSLEAGIA